MKTKWKTKDPSYEEIARNSKNILINFFTYNLDFQTQGNILSIHESLIGLSNNCQVIILFNLSHMSKNINIY